MGEWWIYPIVGIGIAFITWIFGADQEGDEDRGAVPVFSHDAHRGDRGVERQVFWVGRFHH